MASRKFKQGWIPTPLQRAAGASASPMVPPPDSALVLPRSAPAAAPQTTPEVQTNGPSSPQALQRSTAALTAAAAQATQRAAAAGTTLASVAGSAIRTARTSAAGTAFLSAASSAMDSVRSSAAGSVLASAAGTAMSAARASAAAAAVASSMVPIPSPVALINRTSFILKYFLKALVREIFRSILSLLGRKRERSSAAALEAREFAERLGGMWVLLAHLASLRGDLLGMTYCNELARTRDLTTPGPFSEIRKIIEQELRTVGTSFEEVFVEFDEQPITCRSFGQVHRARLREGNREVTVRVRAPDALARAKTDWRYMRFFLFIAEHLDLEPHLRWDDLAFEVKAATDDLLDLRSEVDEIRRIGKLMRPRKIYIPQPFRRYCTEQMLVREYIQGVTIGDLMQMTVREPGRCDDWLHENQIDPRRVWRRLFNAHHELLFEHNLFFTELTPSSIVLLKGNRLAFVSLGTIGTLDADLQRRYRYLYRALLSEDYSKTCDYYLTLGPALPYVDITNMKQLTLRALRKWESRTHVKSRPYSEKSIGAAMGELARCASSQELPTIWNLARLQLAERMVNTSLEFLEPTKNSIKALQSYERAAQMRAIENAAAKPKKIRKRFEGAVDAAQLNMQLIENFESDGENIRRRLIGVQAKLSKVSEVAGRLVVMIAKLALVVLAIQLFLVTQHGTQAPLQLPGQGSVGRALSALRPQSRAGWIILILFLFYIRRFLMKIARQLFTKEVSPSDVG